MKQTGMCASSNISLTTVTSLAILVIIGLCTTEGEAVVHGDKNLLKMLALQIEANVDSVVTWTGDVTMVDTSHRGEDYSRVHESTVSFIASRPDDAVRWRKQTRNSRLVVGGKDVPDPEAGIFNGMIKKDRLFRYYKRSVVSQKHNRLNINDTGGLAPNMLDEYFVPQFFMTKGGTPYNEFLMFLHRNADDVKLSDWHIKEDGRRITLTSTLQGTVNEYEFDRDSGGMCVAYRSVDPSNNVEWLYEYDNVGGVWVVCRVAFTQKYQLDGVPVARTKLLEWSSNAVNTVVPSSEFEIEQLGVRSGDFIYDNVTGVRFQYKAHGTGRYDLPNHLPSLSEQPLATTPASGVPQLEDGSRAPQE